MKRKIIILVAVAVFLLCGVYAYAKPSVVNSIERTEQVMITDVSHWCIAETNHYFMRGYVEEYEDNYIMCVEYQGKKYEFDVDRYTYETYRDREGIMIDATVEILEYSNGDRKYKVVSVK